MRVCIEKATGKLIESQNGGSTEAHLETLRQNALNQGWSPEDVEVFFEDDADFAVRLAAQQESDLTIDDKRKVAFPQTDELVVALWEKIVEDRPEAADALQVKREKVKEDYPK